MKRREKLEEMNSGGMEEILGVNLRHKSMLVHRTCASTACFQIWYTRSGKPRLPISSTDSKEFACTWRLDATQTSLMKCVLHIPDSATMNMMIG